MKIQIIFPNLFVTPTFFLTAVDSVCVVDVVVGVWVPISVVVGVWSVVMAVIKLRFTVGFTLHNGMMYNGALHN